MGNYAPIHPLCVTLLLTVVKFHKSTLIHSNHGLAANPSPFSDKILAPDRKLLRQTTSAAALRAAAEKSVGMKNLSGRRLNARRATSTGTNAMRMSLSAVLFNK